jgi:hypothetical protein
MTAPVNRETLRALRRFQIPQPDMPEQTARKPTLVGIGVFRRVTAGRERRFDAILPHANTGVVGAGRGR